MKQLLDRLQSAFSNLQEREKLFVLGGGLLILAGIIYLAILPQWDRHTQLVEQKNDLQADMQWLQDQRAVLIRLVNSCSSSSASGNGQEVLTRLVRRNQLRLDSLRATGSGFRVGLSGSDANRIVRLAHQIACEGYAVSYLEVSKPTEDTGTLVANMEVQKVD